MKYELFFDVIPKGVQSFRATRTGHKYQDPKVVSWKTLVALMASQSLPEGYQVMTKEVVLHKLVFRFPPTKAMLSSKKKRAEFDEALERGVRVHKSSKPDLMDNLSKGFIDALSGVVWADDKIIVASRDLAKVYHHKPGIELVFSGE
jgi:Holliday junction resolvase RusA-like endonuclease